MPVVTVKTATGRKYDKPAITGKAYQECQLVRHERAGKAIGRKLRYVGGDLRGRSGLWPPQIFFGYAFTHSYPHNYIYGHFRHLLTRAKSQIQIAFGGHAHQPA